MQSLDRRPVVRPVYSAADRLAARGYQLVDKETASVNRRDPASIRISKGGQITLAPALCDAIGNPKRVLLMLGGDNNSLAIVATRDNDPKGFTISDRKGKAQNTITSQRIAKLLTDGAEVCWFVAVSTSDGVIEADRIAAP